MQSGRDDRRAARPLRNARPFTGQLFTAEPLEERRLLSTASFSPAVTTALQIGSAATFTLSGDVNNDGIPDLIAQHSSSQAQVFLGNASGTFTAGQVIATGGQPLALGDFNGDGSLDLATTSGVLIGAGNGTFTTTPATAPGLAAATVNLFSADFNGDGNTDLGAATYTTASNGTSTVALTVFLGTGSGTFGAATTTPIATVAGITSRYANFVTGDFNGDGIIDIASPFGVSLGSGNGTFASVLPFPLSSTPTTPLIAAGDFNGDGKLDMAVLPNGSNSAANLGQVEILLGTGNGTFTDAGTQSVGNVTVSALSTGDLNSDGRDDVLIGLSASGAPSVATLISNGDGTFATPVFYSVSGTPIAIYTGDFNGDGSLDILSANGANGATPVTSQALPIVAASTLLNTTPAPTAPTIALTSSANPVVTGVPLQLKATVLAPTTGTVTSTATPTGSVTFYDGATAIGTATLVTGIARFTTTTLPLGKQTITAVYSGDGNYATVTSTAFTQTVLFTANKVPLLVPSITAATLPSPFISGDKGSVTVAITDVGGSSANGTVAVQLYASRDGAVDSTAIAIGAPSLRKVAVHVGSGGSRTISTKFSAGSYPAGSYTLLAVLTPVSGFTADQVSQSPGASTAAFTSAGSVFGTIGSHKNIKFAATDENGAVGLFSLSGPGTGTVTQTNGVTDVTLSGTTSGSTLTITSTSGRFDFHNIVVNGSLKSFNAPSAAIDGAVTVTGSLSQLKLGATGAATTSVTVAGRVPAMLSMGDASGLTFSTAGLISTLTANTWTGGIINASSIRTLTVKGNLSADVFTHEGGQIQKATLGALGGSVWAAAGGIGTLKVNTTVTSARVLAGVDAGADDAFGTSDDIYAAATIGSVFVGGADTSSTIAAGVGPASGGTVLDGLVLLPKGSIRSITVNGALASDSRFLASNLPTTATITGVKTAKSGDPRFQV